MPDVLLLDEPTNHLDLDSIAWLEELLKGFRGSVVVITHDRAFLDAIATRIVELDRGVLRSYPGNFAAYEARKAEQLSAEALANARADKLLAQEEVWVRKGVEARRTRSVGRVARLEALRAQRAARRETLGRVRLEADSGISSGKIVAELKDVSMRFGDKLIVKDFSSTILRGDKVGLIGPNGAGKTTLLKLILGELQPTSGSVRQGTRIEVAYFDQMRSALDLDATLADTISPGSEWIETGARQEARDELPHRLPVLARARQLAGAHALRRRAQPGAAGAPARPAGERAGARRADQRPRHRHPRAARGDAAEPCRHGVPGEPRPALPRQRRHQHDRLGRRRVARPLARVRGRLRGLEDAARARPRPGAAGREAQRAGAEARARGERGRRRRPPAAKPKKLSYKEQRELDGLPARIEALELEQKELAALLGSADFYADDPARVEQAQMRVAQIDDELTEALERWELLGSR